MITVQLNKAGFEYDIHSLVKAFFPAEDVLVCVGEPKEQSGVSFHIVTDYLEHCIRTVFYEAGGQGRPCRNSRWRWIFPTAGRLKTG